MSQQSSASSSSLASRGVPSTSLIKALKHLFKPLVRLLLANGITLPYLANLFKELYIEVADKEFALDGKKQTDSRISLLTGIHRKDTRRLREQIRQDQYSIPENISLSAQVIARWIGKPEYQDDDGQPRALAKKLSGKSSGVDFESLVKSVSKQDIRPRVVLDEWLRLGIVHIDAHQQVVLDTQAFIPEDNFSDKAYYFGQNLHDHIAAGSHNLLGKTPTFFDRSVYYNCLSSESVQKLNDLSQQLGMDALKQLNHEAMRLQEQDQDLERELARINFGIYFYSQAHNSSEEDSQKNKQSKKVDSQ